MFSPLTIIWVFPKKKRDIPKWMVKIMENPIKMDDLRVPLFSETSKKHVNSIVETPTPSKLQHPEGILAAARGGLDATNTMVIWIFLGWPPCRFCSFGFGMYKIQPRETRKSKFSFTICLQSWVLGCDTKLQAANLKLPQGRWNSSHKKEYIIQRWCRAVLPCLKQAFIKPSEEPLNCTSHAYHLRSLYPMLSFKTKPSGGSSKLWFPGWHFPKSSGVHTVSSPRKCWWIIIICRKKTWAFSKNFRHTIWKWLYFNKDIAYSLEHMIHTYLLTITYQLKSTFEISQSFSKDAWLKFPMDIDIRPCWIAPMRSRWDSNSFFAPEKTTNRTVSANDSTSCFTDLLKGSLSWNRL